MNNSTLSLLIRGAACHLFYTLKYYPKVMAQKLIKPTPIVDIQVNDSSYKMKVDLNDSGLSRDIYTARIREVPNVFIFSDYIRKNANKLTTVLDVGSNLGYYLLLTAVLAKKKPIKLFGIEPVQQNFELLTENVKLNNLQNITLKHLALGNKDSQVSIIIPEGRNLAHISDIKNISEIKTFAEDKVQMQSLHTFFAENKIPKKGILFRWDVEGYEYQMIKGNIELFKQIKQSFITMEFHPFLIGKKKSIEMIRLLENVGFVLDFVTSSYPLYFLSLPSPVRKYIEQNFTSANHSTFGKVDRFKSLQDVINALEDEQDSIYYGYPNIHLFLYKR